MQYLGNIGSSRMCSFYADGDGSFRPKVSFEYPEELPEVKDIDGIVTFNRSTRRLDGMHSSHEGDFVIDSDSIAWKIYHEEDEDYIRPINPQSEAIKYKGKQ